MKKAERSLASSGRKRVKKFSTDGPILLDQRGTFWWSSVTVLFMRVGRRQAAGNSVAEAMLWVSVLARGMVGGRGVVDSLPW